MLIFTDGRSPLLTTGKDDWETPDRVFAPLHAQYHFILDAAANQTNHKVARWFGPGGECPNALTVPWPLDEGNIWLNPPYSRKLQARFIRKAWREARGQGHTHHFFQVVCLLPARTDTKLFHEVILPHAAEIKFLKGRIKFVGGANGAPFPSMLVIF